jgi:hypothetical protein
MRIYSIKELFMKRILFVLSVVICNINAYADESKLVCNLIETFEHKSGGVEKTPYKAIVKIINDKKTKTIFVDAEKSLFSITTNSMSGAVYDILDDSDKNSWEISTKSKTKSDGVEREKSIKIDRNTGMLMASIHTDGIIVYLNGNCERVNMNSRKF